MSMKTQVLVAFHTMYYDEYLSFMDEETEAPTDGPK